MRPGVVRDYAGYIDGQIVAVGTLEEVAKRLGVTAHTAKTLLCPSRKHRYKQRHIKEFIEAVAVETIICKGCGAEVYLEDAYRGNLCESCASKKEGMAKVCDWCGKEFVPARYNQKFCAEECRTAKRRDYFKARRTEVRRCE